MSLMGHQGPQRTQSRCPLYANEPNSSASRVASKSADGGHGGLIRSLRRRGDVATAPKARPDIDHAQIHQRAMELALPFGRRCKVGFSAMLKQAGAGGKYRIERQARLLQRHGPKKSNVEVRTLSGGQAIRADVQRLHRIKCAERAPRIVG